MTIWNQDEFQKAWNFASDAHNGQCVPGTNRPYINHIGNVAMEVMAAIAFCQDINNPDLLVQCALLHDTIEDTKITFDEVKNTFSLDVANGVAALSKNSDLKTKADRMADSIERIKQQPDEIWMVKLADRITNLQPPPKHWTREKTSAYRNEAIVILDNLGRASPYLSVRMKEKISEYEGYV